MEYECNDCHLTATGKRAEDEHFLGTYGPCKTCGQVKFVWPCFCFVNEEVKVAVSQKAFA